MSREERLKRRSAQPSRAPERVPVATSSSVTGEVPDKVLETIVEDVLKRSNRDKHEVKVQRAESVMWSDGSLGCPKPGAMYTQALVRGYWIVLQVADRAYDYRATEQGHFVLCDRPPMQPPGNEPQ